MKKTLIILGTCIAILDLTFGTVSIAQNYYKSTGSSEKEKAVYQMAENVADVFDMSVSEAEKRIMKIRLRKKRYIWHLKRRGLPLMNRK